MRAIIQRKFGAPSKVLHLGEAERPVPADDEVLVRVRASSANPWDWHFIRGEPVFMRLAGAGLRSPKHPIPGGDLAGTVEEVGIKVTGFKRGDEVYGFGHGAFAEYIAIDHKHLALKPDSLDFEQAAAVPLAAITALQGLAVAGGINAGQKVLIIGASGGVGTFAVQIAKAHGAEVTGVCSTRNPELVKSIGADHVIDYTATDFTQGHERYDLVLQLGGTDSASSIRRVMTTDGTLVLSSGDGNRWIGPLRTMIWGMVSSIRASQSVKTFVAKETTDALDTHRELIDAGKVTPVIDSTYPLADAGKAVALVEDGSPGGKVVVTL